jgi:hypothetical protein
VPAPQRRGARTPCRARAPSSAGACARAPAPRGRASLALRPTAAVAPILFEPAPPRCAGAHVASRRLRQCCEAPCALGARLCAPLPGLHVFFLLCRSAAAISPRRTPGDEARRVLRAQAGAREPRRIQLRGVREPEHCRASCLGSATFACGAPALSLFVPHRAQVFGRLFSKKEMRILMVGLDAAGKTTILYKLKVLFVKSARTPRFMSISSPHPASAGK